MWYLLRKPKAWYWSLLCAEFTFFLVSSLPCEGPWVRHEQTDRMRCCTYQTSLLRCFCLMNLIKCSPQSNFSMELMTSMETRVPQRQKSLMRSNCPQNIGCEWALETDNFGFSFHICNQPVHWLWASLIYLLSFVVDTIGQHSSFAGQAFILFFSPECFVYCSFNSETKWTWPKPIIVTPLSGQ